jgi:hypothetical protein
MARHKRTDTTSSSGPAKPPAPAPQDWRPQDDSRPQKPPRQQWPERLEDVELEPEAERGAGADATPARAAPPPPRGAARPPDWTLFAPLPTPGKWGPGPHRTLQEIEQRHGENEAWERQRDLALMLARQAAATNNPQDQAPPRGPLKELPATRPGGAGIGPKAWDVAKAICTLRREGGRWINIEKDLLSQIRNRLGGDNQVSRRTLQTVVSWLRAEGHIDL